VLLAISTFFGGDDTDMDAETDINVDVDVGPDADLDVDGDMHLDASHADGAGAILQWFSIKALAVAAVGFGFMGWATTSNGNATAIVWIASILTGGAVWAMAVLFLFPWLRRQQGHDLQPASAYQGLTAQVVVRIPADGIGIVQFADPSGAVVRRDARSVHRDHEVAVGTRVAIILATAECVTVDEFSIVEEPN